jgi:hypothetical protein
MTKEHSGTMDKNLLSQFYDGGQLFKWKVEPVLLWWTIVQWEGRNRSSFSYFFTIFSKKKKNTVSKFTIFYFTFILCLICMFL